MQTLRLRSAQAAIVILALFAVFVMALQCRDFKAATEVFPISGFLVTLTLASIAIGWSRISPPMSTVAELKRIKRAGLDLILSSALTLCSAALLLLAQDRLLKTTLLINPVLVLHLLSLGLGLFFGWLGVASLLNQAARPSPEQAAEAADHNKLRASDGQAARPRVNDAC